jgi:hypothetical protein
MTMNYKASSSFLQTSAADNITLNPVAVIALLKLHFSVDIPVTHGCHSVPPVVFPAWYCHFMQREL